LTALNAVRELDLDGWDLSVWIQIVAPLRNAGDGRTEAAIAVLYVVALEDFGDLLQEGHLLGFLEKRRNNQQGLELAFGWLALSLSNVTRRSIEAAEDGQPVDAF
jgi:hypothetical protein